MITASPNAVVLLVEDSPDDQLIFEIAMGDSGLTNPVHIVENGAQALAWITGQPPYDDRELYPAPDVVFLDINMPRVGGLEMLRRLRETGDYSDLPIVMTTVSDADRDVLQAFELGSLYYVNKPISAANLRHFLA